MIGVHLPEHQGLHAQQPSCASNPILLSLHSLPQVVAEILQVHGLFSFDWLSFLDRHQSLVILCPCGGHGLVLQAGLPNKIKLPFFSKTGIHEQGNK